MISLPLFCVKIRFCLFHLGLRRRFLLRQGKGVLLFGGKSGTADRADSAATLFKLLFQPVRQNSRLSADKCLVSVMVEPFRLCGIGGQCPELLPQQGKLLFIQENGTDLLPDSRFPGQCGHIVP